MGGKRAQHGQSLVELAIGSVVLVLLLGGAAEAGRAYYYSVLLHGAAREAARHAAWFDRTDVADPNPYLNDGAVLEAANQTLLPAGIPAALVATGDCLAPSDGNPDANPPFPASAYGGTPNRPLLYVCYTSAGGGRTGSLPTSPSSGYGGGGEVQVTLLMPYGTLTGLLDSLLGSRFPIAASAHMAVQTG